MCPHRNLASFFLLVDFSDIPIVTLQLQFWTAKVLCQESVSNQPAISSLKTKMIPGEITVVYRALSGFKKYRFWTWK